MITADQLVAHAVGDYVIQSDWMAQRKSTSSVAAAVHAVTYALPFATLTLAPLALAFVVVTHFAVDRWRLARYVCWVKNRPWPGSMPWTACAATGYNPDRPPWLTVWLMIAADNVVHVLLNAVALRWLS